MLRTADLLTSLKRFRRGASPVGSLLAAAAQLLRWLGPSSGGTFPRWRIRAAHGRFGAAASPPSFTRSPRASGRTQGCCQNACSGRKGANGAVGNLRGCYQIRIQELAGARRERSVRRHRQGCRPAVLKFDELRVQHVHRCPFRDAAYLSGRGLRAELCCCVHRRPPALLHPLLHDSPWSNRCDDADILLNRTW